MIKTPRCVTVDDTDWLICNLFRSGYDLELRSNFQNDLLRSTNGSNDASWQEEHDAGKINDVPFLSQKLLLKKITISKIQKFKNSKKSQSFWPSGGQRVDLGSKLRAKRTLKELSNAFFRGAGSTGSWDMGWSVKNVKVESFTIDDFWWSDL